MKHIVPFNSKLLSLAIACSLVGVSKAKNVRYFADDLDDFFEASFTHMKQVQEEFAHMMEQMRDRKQTMFGMAPSKEEREALQVAREHLSKIKPTIESDDNYVYIRFNLEGVNKNDIKVVKEHYGFVGTIPTKDGEITFAISPLQLELKRSVHLRKESKNTETTTTKSDKSTTQDKATITQKEEKKVQPVYFYSTSSIDIEAKVLPFVVDLATAQAKTKDTTLTITIAKKKEALLPIAHE